MIKINLIILCFYSIINLVICDYKYSRIPITKRNNLHMFMDDDELEHYFGPKTKRTKPYDYEIIDLPIYTRKRNNGNDDYQNDDSNFKMEFSAFGNPIKLNFHPNDVLVSPSIKIVRKSENDKEIVLKNRNNEIKNCHFLHSDHESVAAISNCFDNEINGILLLPNSTLEIRPLTKRLQSVLNLPEPLLSEDDDKENHENFIPHIVKRADSIPSSIFNDDFMINKDLKFENKRGNFFTDDPGEPDSIKEMIEEMNSNSSYSKRGSRERAYTVEVGVFFDEAAYRIFSPFFSYDETKLRDMLLAYMNGVQALYHHPSLGTPIDISIVYIEFMRKQPSTMPHHDGERGQLLDSFCDYQKSINPGDDTNPQHWDMGLYISGLDFFAYENGKKNTVTMGLATVGGVCIDQYACVIAEYGTTNIFGKPYPSAGFTSVYILAHEMGHNLGMHHDSSGNTCSKEGFVMSPSRGVIGETTWSRCSAETIMKLGYAQCLFDKPTRVSFENDAWKYFGYPGQTWTAKRQCEILLVDTDAYVSHLNGLETICNNLQCRTPHRTGYYSSGPALTGTDCGTSKWCDGGSCTWKTTLPQPLSTVHGGWSEWQMNKCSSGCTINSRGYQTKTRSCNNPKPQNTDEGCEGHSYDVVLCNDKAICNERKRKSIIEYASKRCEIFSISLPDLDPSGKGLQAPHESNRLWMACAVFCRRSETGSYYTPRVELNDIGVDAYFPDGTWCHSDGTYNYYCMQHHCLPENFERGKHRIGVWALGEDIPLAGNAQAYPKPIEGNMLKYLSLSEKGLPLLTHIDESDVRIYNKETDWDNNDYLELPAHAKNGGTETGHSISDIENNFM